LWGNGAVSLDVTQKPSVLWACLRNLKESWLRKKAPADHGRSLGANLINQHRYQEADLITKVTLQFRNAQASFCLAKIAPDRYDDS
jgi:hypothetical protein